MNDCCKNEDGHFWRWCGLALHRQTPITELREKAKTNPAFEAPAEKWTSWRIALDKLINESSE